MRKLKVTLSLLLLLIVAAACTGQTPIPVFVTPTPVGPTSLPVIEQTATPLPVTIITATPSPLPPTPGEGTSYGPVVPPDYTLAPTDTPRPTSTPIPGTPTVTPTATISPTPPPGLNPAMIGIQIHPRVDQEEWREMLHWAQQLNVGWIKVQFPWDEMEPDGPGSQSVHWRELELYVQDAVGRGFQVMVSITKAPDWARPTNEENGPPGDPQLLVNFINEILTRYGQGINAIEIWNEPNLQREWTGAPISGAEYMRLFDPAYRAITTWSAENSHPIRVVTAGLAPVGNLDGTVDDRDYLRQMYEAGLANYPDVAVGIHPYGWGNAPDSRCCDPVEGRSWDDDPHFFFLDTLETYRQIMVNYGHSNAPLWLTEFGWATYDGLGGYPAPQGFFDYVTEQTQAQYLIKALDMLENSSTYDYVGVTMIWNLNFAVIEGAVARGEEQAGYSLLRPDKSWRPAFTALHDALNQSP